MSARRVMAVARRIAEGFRRDRRSLALLIIAPLVVTALLGWVLRGSSSGSVHVVVAGLPTQLTSALASAAEHSTAATRVTISTVADAATARADVRSGRADAALIAEAPGSAAPVVTIVTAGADPAEEGSEVGAIQAVIVAAAGSLLPAAVGALPVIRHETIFLSPTADQLDALAPVFLGFFAYFFVFILTGISFLRERVGGTLERLLATPVTRAEIVLGYSIGFSFFAAIQVLLLTAFVLAKIDVPALGPIPAFTIGLDVQSAGSPAFAFVVALLLAIGAVNLGIFLSTYARTELQVVQFIPLVIVPQGLLGGIFWPVDRLPDILQAVAHVMPVTYAVDALREVMIKGADIGSTAVQGDLAILAGIAVFFIVLGAGTIKREIA
jgi:ABC-2 type transport system permease protein